MGRQGVGSFCRELLCFNAAPCRPMPLPVTCALLRDVQETGGDKAHTRGIGGYESAQTAPNAFEGCSQAQAIRSFVGGNVYLLPDNFAFKCHAPESVGAIAVHAMVIDSLEDTRHQARLYVARLAQHVLARFLFHAVS